MDLRRNLHLVYVHKHILFYHKKWLFLCFGIFYNYVISLKWVPQKQWPMFSSWFIRLGEIPFSGAQCKWINTLLHCCIAETSLWEISWWWIYPKFSHVVGVERVWMLNLAKWWRNDKTRGVPWNWKLLKQMLERSEMLFEQICQNLVNILVDRLHPVGGWQILWVEAAGQRRLGWWLESEKGWKGLAAGSRVSTQASRDSTPFLSGSRGRMASGPPTHVWVPCPPF